MGWPSLAGAQGTKLYVSLRCHWNNRKYGAGKLRFSTHKNSFTNYPVFGHILLQMFASLVLGQNTVRNISSKGHQIVSLSEVPTSHTGPDHA
jgi:hypothetical protein